MYHHLLITALSACLLAVAGCTPDKPSTSDAGKTAQVFTRKSSAASSTSRSINPETTILSTANDLAEQQQVQKELHSIQGNIIFSENGRGVAYIQADGDRQRVVHNGRKGDRYDKISRLEVSPDGSRVSYRCVTAGKEQLVNDGVPRNLYDNVRDQVYSPDSKHLAYLGKIGNTMQIILDEKVIQEGNEFYYGLGFTRDSNKFMFTIRADGGRPARLVILDLVTGARSEIECLPTPQSWNKATDTVAIAISDGDKQRLLVVPLNSPMKRQASSGLYHEITNITLGPDGKSVTFVDVRGAQRYLVVNGKEYKLPDELATVSPPVFQSDLKGAGIVLATRERHGFKSIFYQSARGSSSDQQWYPQIFEPTYGKANVSAYVVKQNEKYFVVLGGKKGPTFDMIVTPMFSPDGTKLIYRARDGGRRFLVVADVAANQHQRQIEYDMVFEPTFTADGKSVAYGVKQGNQLIWKVEKL